MLLSLDSRGRVTRHHARHVCDTSAAGYRTVRGLATVLSPRAIRAWRRANERSERYGSKGHERLLAVELHEDAGYGLVTIWLVNGYAPDQTKPPTHHLRARDDFTEKVIV